MERQADSLPLLTPHEAAELLHVPTEKILDMIEHKELQAFKVGHYWRIRRSAVNKLIQRSR